MGTDGTISYVFVSINDDAVPNTCAEVTNQNGGTAAATTAIVDPLTDVILNVGVPYNCVVADATATYFDYRMYSGDNGTPGATGAPVPPPLLFCFRAPQVLFILATSLLCPCPGFARRVLDGPASAP